MAHYAVLDNDNTVSTVITGVHEYDTDTLPAGFASWEEFYSDALGSTVIRCSYNGNIRGHYPASGDTYDPDLDQFVAPPEPELSPDPDAP